MKIKKIVALLLAVILTFGLTSTAFALPENEDSEIELYGAILDNMGTPTISRSESGVKVKCAFESSVIGTATISVTIKQSTSESGSKWTTYDFDSDSVSTPYESNVSISFSSLPSGYYYLANVTIRVRDSSTGRSESTTKSTSIIYI